LEFNVRHSEFMSYFPTIEESDNMGMHYLVELLRSGIQRVTPQEIMYGLDPKKIKNNLDKKLIMD